MIRKNTQSSQRRIAAAVADDWQMQSLCLGHSKGQCNGWGIVLRCDKVDIVGTFCLQFQKNVGQSLYRNPLAALPGCMEDSRKVIHYLHETYGDKIYISIMNQFTPVSELLSDYPELNHTISASDYDALVDYAIDIGVENGFIQEGETAKESFIPPFDNEGV